jgi:hypothetical protein
MSNKVTLRPFGYFSQFLSFILLGKMIPPTMSKTIIFCQKNHKKFEGLTLKEQSPFFGPFLEFGHAIVDAIFVQKISNFW